MNTIPIIFYCALLSGGLSFITWVLSKFTKNIYLKHGSAILLGLCLLPVGVLTTLVDPYGSFLIVKAAIIVGGALALCAGTKGLLTSQKNVA